VGETSHLYLIEKEGACCLSQKTPKKVRMQQALRGKDDHVRKDQLAWDINLPFKGHSVFAKREKKRGEKIHP